MLEKQGSMKEKKERLEFELAGDSWKAQFDIPGSLVDVMYRQCIIWCGMYFSPMIPVLGVAASAWTCFIRKRYLFKFCGRPKKALGVENQLKFFYGMMLLAILCSLLPFNYLLDRSPKCGPHQGLNVLTDTETTLDKDMPYVLIGLFSYVFNGMLLLPMFILSLVYAGYVRGVKNVQAVNAKALKDKLCSEKSEKRQILKDYHIRL